MDNTGRRSQEPRAAPPTESGPSAPTRKRVLLADDDRLIVATLGQRLRTAGYEVLEAFDGPRALDLCMTLRPDLAIIDHSMPGKSGVEIAREIAGSIGTPVIFLSAYSDESIVTDAVAAGAMTYLVKPIDTEQLLPIVRAALQRARELHALRFQAGNLTMALQKDRNVSVAVGLLMAKFNIGQREAFERLRRHARSIRAKMEDVATELLRANDETGRMLEQYGDRVSTRSHDVTEPEP